MTKLRATPGLVAGGLFAYCASTYVGFHAHRLWTQAPPPPGISEPAAQAALVDTTQTYAAIADDYDAGIAYDECVMRIAARRAAAIAHLSKRVLECAAGTGRNLPVFARRIHKEYHAFNTNSSSSNNSITSLTLSDASPRMLQRAFDAFKLLKADPATSLPPTTFSILDISSADPLPQNLLNSFDSVLDTFGLCSVRDPTQSVINMRNLCKPGGKIVLLEHGRSAFPLQFIADMLNSALDKTAQNHAEKWGCWWNRDLETIIRQIEGLQIESVHRYHLGTTIEIVATRISK